MTTISESRERADGTLAQRVVAAVERRGLGNYLLTEPLVVGVSGGVDSLALINLLCEIRGEQAVSTLHVAHLNHGLRRNAGEDALAVERASQLLGLPFSLEVVDVAALAAREHMSIEDAGRRARYSFLGRLAAAHGATVCVAHTADDQAETILLNSLRGTGVSGLGGMSMLSPLGPHAGGLPTSKTAAGAQAGIYVFRPLLETWRGELEEYCEANGLKPSLDESNRDLRYTRNRVRHQLIPLLEQSFNVEVKSALLRLADTAREDNILLDSLARDALLAVSREDGDRILVFDTGKLAGLPKAIGRRVVRLALLKLSRTLEGLTLAHIDRALAVLSAAPGSEKAVNLPGRITAEQSGGEARLFVQGSVPRSWYERWPSMARRDRLSVSPGHVLPLTNGWALSAAIAGPEAGTVEAGDMVALFDADVLGELGPVCVRTRRAGDTISPIGLHGRKSLQDLYTDAKIPPEVRSTLPVVALEKSPGIVLWVPGPGGRRSETAMLETSTRRVLRLEFSRRGRNGG